MSRACKSELSELVPAPASRSLSDASRARILGKRALLWPLLVVLSVLCLLYPPNGSAPRAQVVHPATARSPSPDRLDNGLSDIVQWDNYSLIIKGQRIFLHSGEFHPFRLPVPDLWLDVLQKIKAAGFNAISIYVHWGVSNPSRGVLDFNDWRSLTRLYDVAQLVGLFVVVRPGPYINAETTAGGMAHWAMSEVQGGHIRTNETDFRDAWLPYITAIAKMTVPYQVTQGGPVIAVQIDNEFTQSPAPRAQYFAQLESTYKKLGIVVPLTYNDPGQNSNFINGTGAVDIYGLDSYPQGFDCSRPDRWNPVVTNYRQYHARVNPSQPFYIPEFQGGAFDAWGPTSPGYDACFQLTGPDFEQVFYKHLWASNAKLINYYMIYGGTSWGGVPFPGVYTSYDYGSAIRENRMLSSKFGELKSQGLFIRSTPDFYKTNWINDSTTDTRLTTDRAAHVTILQNPDTLSRYYIARQADSGATRKTSFKLIIQTSQGSFQIPKSSDSLELNGRQSNLIVADYSFGTHSKVLYSTAEVFFAGKIGDRDVLFLHGSAAQHHEASIWLRGASGSFTKNPLVVFDNPFPQDLSLVSFLPGIDGLITVWDSQEQLILYADLATSNTFFSPVLPGPGELANHWQFGSNTTLLVGGPHLVRNATLEAGVLELHGDLDRDAMLTVIGPSDISKITWNGQTIDNLRVDGTGFFKGTLMLSSSVTLPSTVALDDWKYADGIPEVGLQYSDDSWVSANRTRTNIPAKPRYGNGTVLYGCDYGFCENVVLYRGHFTGRGTERSVSLMINGGSSFAAGVWVNSKFVGTAYGNSTNNRNLVEEVNKTYAFPTNLLQVAEDNVVTVLLDNMGLDETKRSNPDTCQSPRGIRGYRLSEGEFSGWKVQGKLGGYTNYPDKTRGILNEGGSFGERQGWHLPEFNTSGWETRSLSAGSPEGSTGVGFFVTTFSLNIPGGFDAPMSFVFDDADGSTMYRAYLFVNGWMMGKRIAYLGPQKKFPVHEGILNYEGKNTVAVMLWVTEANANVKASLKLVVDAKIEGGVGRISTNNPVWTSRSR